MTGRVFSREWFTGATLNSPQVSRVPLYRIKGDDINSRCKNDAPKSPKNELEYPPGCFSRETEKSQPRNPLFKVLGLCLIKSQLATSTYLLLYPFLCSPRVSRIGINETLVTVNGAQQVATCLYQADRLVAEHFAPAALERLMTLPRSTVCVCVSVYVRVTKGRGIYSRILLIY